MSKTENLDPQPRPVQGLKDTLDNDEHLQSFVNAIGISSELILNNAADPVLHLDCNGQILGMNPVAEAILGYQEADLKGQNFFDLIPEEYRSFLTSRFVCRDEEDDSLLEDTDWEELFLLRFLDGSGTYSSYEAVIIPYEDDGERDDPSYFLNLWRPEKDGEELKSQLNAVRNNYEALTETITEAVIMVDEEFKILYANSSSVRVFGYSREELIGAPFGMLFPEEVYTRYSALFRKNFYLDAGDMQNHPKELELLAKSKNRGVAPVEISFGNSRELEERTLICIIRDITQRKNVERKLRYLAYHDKLTDLGNRDLFNMDIENFFKINKTHKDLCGALLFLDLDGFKQVNDTLGHQAGDLLLISTAKRLRNLMRENDMIYRFGGDEFVILLSRIQKASDVDIVCKKILQTIQRAYNFDKQGQKHKVNIGVSIGVALLPEHGRDRETVTRHADLAMYSSKERGKNRYTLFSEELTLSAQNKWLIDQGLKTALMNQEMSLRYQPIVFKDGKIAGVEALIRWTHPDQGLIPPDKFIPSAEESGIINSIGQWVLEHALSDIHEINNLLDRDLYVSINISTRQLNAPDFTEIIDKAVQRSEMNPENVKLELTETFLMKSPEKAIESLIKTKEKQTGMKIVIDDFGKGYSSLQYLSRLPIDVIKIDRSFIKEIPAENNRKVINSIVNLAQSLNMEIVAEGIETEEQLHYPPLEDCQYYQGYLFSKPLNYLELLKFLEVHTK